MCTPFMQSWKANTYPRGIRAADPGLALRAGVDLIESGGVMRRALRLVDLPRCEMVEGTVEGRSGVAGPARAFLHIEHCES